MRLRSWFSGVRSERMGVLRTVEIFCRVYRSGWVVLVHHFDTVTGSLPNCSASHLPVCPVSASTAFILLIFCRSTFASITNKLIPNANLLIYSTTIYVKNMFLNTKPPTRNRNYENIAPFLVDIYSFSQLVKKIFLNLPPKHSKTLSLLCQLTKEHLSDVR